MNKNIWRCECGGLLDLEFDARFPLKEITKRKETLWRYREALPVEDDANIVSFDEGFTPLISVHFNQRNVLIKEDHLFPSGSFKDRGATVMVSKVKEIGVNRIVEDSSGNAGAALAAYAARAHILCDIFVPDYTSEGKLVQIRAYGMNLTKVKGSREDTSSEAMKFAAKYYYASHYWNPFFFHGTKTFSFEVCEQLGWKSPDTLILPVGNGSLLIGVYIGFQELMRENIIEKIPRFIGVQPENCAPLACSFKKGLNTIIPIEKKPTIAEGIMIANPIRGVQILNIVRESNGDFIEVSEEEIIEALKEMIAMGFYIEPTSAATIAGVKKYLPRSSSGEVIVSTFTGHGLKTTETLSKIF